MTRRNGYMISDLTGVESLEADTIKGLSSNPKYLFSKYFYDDIGSTIFQEISKMPEYYLTRKELEIFSQQNEVITDCLLSGNQHFDLIELGSGDGSKTKILLKSILDRNISFKFIPVDISAKANQELDILLGNELPSLNLEPLTGDFFNLSEYGTEYRNSNKVIMFLGSNIGNFTLDETDLFLTKLSEFCRKGDKVLIGFDLKKSPEIIMNAYDDPHGITKRFNLNYLARLNREIGTDFNLSMFEHHTAYNPLSGYVRSYLVSNRDQIIEIGTSGEKISFSRWEPVLMELSRKFDLATIERLAFNHGFKVIKHFTDNEGWFADSLWIRK
ncbi:MAG: L-histidine N(alpha)-methyltransferase [Bacteroidales bacterium]|nr:L-histidine N(alpha)-methyltransferase [Bacteroidales bacterium]